MTDPGSLEELHLELEQLKRSNSALRQDLTAALNTINRLASSSSRPAVMSMGWTEHHTAIDRVRAGLVNMRANLRYEPAGVYGVYAYAERLESAAEQLAALLPPVDATMAKACGGMEG